MMTTRPSNREQDRFIDLHVHSNHSDGLLTPEHIVRIAAERHLAAISITDHDALSAVRAAVDAGVQNNIEVGSHDPLEEEIRSFINAVIKRSKPLISGEDARDSLELAVDIIKKMRVAEVI